MPRSTKLTLTLALLALPTASAHAAWTETVLTSFNFQYIDQGPFGGLVADAAGNLYGTTDGGGPASNGTAFKMTPPGAGETVWTTKFLTFFKGKETAKNPMAALVFDKSGNLYGTAEIGGPSGFGAVFQLAAPPAGKSAWGLQVIASPRRKLGLFPSGNLVFDATGNLYGVTNQGGAGDGTIFKMTPPAAGKTAWTYTVILDFRGTNGSNPAAGLIFDAAGNLYGTTTIGGAHGDGTVFKLAPPAAGQTRWRQTVLFSFDGTNGGQPSAALALDTEGNLYGTTIEGGANSYGTVFKLAPPAAGKTKWRQTVLFSFDVTNGQFPEAAVILDAAGNLYGTTRLGGAAGDGTVFELSPPAAGKKAWTESVLYAFTGPDGEAPQSTLLFDTKGNLYGTTSEGGAYQCGTVFELAP
jgi:uncharacterized repeat protein (TIGR03803 family)